MADKLYTFGCTFNVLKRDNFDVTDMQLAQLVLILLTDRLACDDDLAVRFVTESIHPIMIGPEGGVDPE